MPGGDKRSRQVDRYAVPDDPRGPGKSLRVIAGMATTRLGRIEYGKHALDSLTEIVALADALEIAPSELVKLPVPAPVNGETDAAIDGLRTAVIAARRNRPGWLVLPVEVYGNG